jgi:hypothetical protein
MSPVFTIDKHDFQAATAQLSIRAERSATSLGALSLSLSPPCNLLSSFCKLAPSPGRLLKEYERGVGITGELT